MPSYYRDRRHLYKTRYDILSELREKNLRRMQLENIFDKTIGALLPAPNRKPVQPDYHHEIFFPKQPRQSKLRFAQLLYELKRDGLIAPTDTKESLSFKITTSGIAWLKKFTEKPHTFAPNYAAQAEKSERVTIVSYDIPERLRIYRDWLRATLREMRLTPMQRSVWVGKVKLPTDFIADITRFKLEKYVEIFEITKAGTLRHRL